MRGWSCSRGRGTEVADAPRLLPVDQQWHQRLDAVHAVDLHEIDAIGLQDLQRMLEALGAVALWSHAHRRGTARRPATASRGGRRSHHRQRAAHELGGDEHLPAQPQIGERLADRGLAVRTAPRCR